MRVTLVVCLLIVVGVSALPTNISTSTEVVPEKLSSEGKSSTAMPKWLRSVRDFIIGPTGILTKTKKFFTGDGEKSLASLKSAIPKSRSEANKTLVDFYRTLKTDATTRLIFVIYLNLAFMLVVYASMFICQIHLHIKQKRADALLRQKKKWDTEEAIEVARHGRQTRLPSLVRSDAGRAFTGPMDNVYSEIPPHTAGSETAIDWDQMVSPSVVKMCDDGTIHAGESTENVRNRKKEPNYLSWGLFQDDEADGLPVETTQQDSVSDEVFVDDNLCKGERRNRQSL